MGLNVRAELDSRSSVAFLSCFLKELKGNPSYLGSFFGGADHFAGFVSADASRG